MIHESLNSNNEDGKNINNSIIYFFINFSLI